MSGIRMIQVGLGLWGRDWAANVLPRVGDVEIVARVDGDPGARRLTAELGILPAPAWYSSLQEALDEVEADAVLATVAIPAHTQVALTALRAGKHVLLEKPFAPSLDEARRVMAEAETRDLVVSIAQNYRFLPAVPLVTELVRAGSLGSVDRGRIDFRRYHPTEDRLSRSPLDHSLVSQISIHHFDLIRAILGREPSRVYCRSWSAPWNAGPGLVSAAAVIDLEGGCVVTYSGSLRSAGAETSWAGDWAIECENGEISWRAGADGSELVQVRPRGAPPRSVTVPPAHHADRVAVMAGFVEAVRSGVAPPTSGRDNLRSLAVMTAALESVASQQPVNVPTP